MMDETKNRAFGTSSLSPPPSSVFSHPSSVYVVTAALTLAFVSLIVVAPLARAHGHDFTALVIYKSFEKFCHQIPERSFYVEGHPLAVCARCTGIYFGFAAAVLAYPFARSLRHSYPTPARKWLLVAVAPALVDFALDFFGIWRNTHLTRTVTGALLGSVTAFFVVPALLDMTRLASRRSRLGKMPLETRTGMVDEQ